MYLLYNIVFPWAASKCELVNGCKTPALCLQAAAAALNRHVIRRPARYMESIKTISAVSNLAHCPGLHGG